MITDNPLKSKIDLEKNPKGTELKVALQREREKSGRYVSIPGDKSHTKIFVRDGEDPEKRILSFIKNINNRTTMWN